MLYNCHIRPQICLRAYAKYICLQPNPSKQIIILFFLKISSTFKTSISLQIFYRGDPLKNSILSSFFGDNSILSLIVWN